MMQHERLEQQHDTDIATLDAFNRDRWKQQLQTTGSGKPEANALNISKALEHAPDLKGIAQYDQFTQKIMLVKPAPWSTDYPRPWNDTDDTEFLSWLQNNDLQIKSPGTVANTVSMVANRNSYDPLKEYLNSLVWDKQPRLTGWLTKYLGVIDSDLNRAIGRAFLISAVARGLQPACQVDHVLCLEGMQGAGKSTMVRILGGDWTQENLTDMHSKDAMAALAGAWFVELSELAAMTRSEVESVKGFISRKIDRYRPSYGRRVQEYERRCVFIATTNEKHYLRDSTGNRRFWPVECTKIDTQSLQDDRDQLFAEAVHAYKQGEPWHLIDQDIINAATIEQANRIEHDPWLAPIAEYMKGRGHATTAQLLGHIDLPKGSTHPGHAKRVSSVMRQLGFSDEVSKAGGERQVIWRRHD